MAADFIESTILRTSDSRQMAEEAQRWWRETADAMRAKGATFMRWSYPEDRPEHVYLEGWRERPDDQGPHPWEQSTVA